MIERYVAAATPSSGSGVAGRPPETGIPRGIEDVVEDCKASDLDGTTSRSGVDLVQSLHNDLRTFRSIVGILLQQIAHERFERVRTIGREFADPRRDIVQVLVHDFRRRLADETASGPSAFRK